IRNFFMTQHRGEVRTYGLNYGEWQAISSVKCSDKRHSFIVRFREKEFSKFEIALPGQHYVQNALAAIVVSNFIGVGIDAIASGLQQFQGVSRRYDMVIERDGVKVIDDYGHTPFEIYTVVKTIKEEYPNSLLLCVPCLRQFHRTERQIKEFASAMLLADTCVIAPIVRGLGDDESTIDILLSEKLASEIRVSGGIAVSVSSDNEAVSKILKILNMSTAFTKIILTIGSGVSKGVIDLLRKEL
ncbi:MAG: cyanophycin synthetase, partial [Patescibacteria group bacterium]